MAKKNLLFISSFYPNPREPHIATYNRQILDGLSNNYDVDAVVPIPWTHRIKLPPIPSKLVSNITVHHPTYFYPPGCLRSSYGNFFHLSIMKSVSKLICAKQFDVVYSSWLYPDAWAAAVVAKSINSPLFVSVLGTDVNRLVKDSDLCRKSLDVVNLSEGVICVCNVLRKKLIDLGCAADKLHYLQNGVDHSIFYERSMSETRQRLNIPDGRKLIVFVGNLKREKGLFELIDAFDSVLTSSKYADIGLVIIGDGKIKKKLIEKAKIRDINNIVTFLGPKSLPEISEWMNAGDVLCLPSYSEGQPNVIIEAQSCHTKIVATAVGGIPDLDDGLGCMKIIPPHDVTSLADALVTMIDKDHESIRFPYIHSWDEYVCKLESIFMSHR